MGIAQMVMGTLIIKVSHLIIICPQNLYLTSLIYDANLDGILPILLLYGKFGVCFTIFCFERSLNQI